MLYITLLSFAAYGAMMLRHRPQCNIGIFDHQLLMQTALCQRITETRQQM